MPEDDIGWESFTVISIDSSPVYSSNYYLHVYLEKKKKKLQTKKYIILMKIFLKIRYYKCSIKIELI